MKSGMISLSLILLWVISVATAGDSAYVKEQMIRIKALSAEQVEGYRQGDGMGQAKAAELNGYPGPRHVLELDEQLGLSTAQRAKTRELYASMKRDARELGQQLLMAEQQLDKRFASQQISAEHVKQLTSEISRLQGRLRAVHLLAHIQQTLLLTEQQVALYQQLRGYSPSVPEHH